ncbi:type VI secretion system-associated FHA domain protein, partial [Mesorhizobium sp. M8A.F.Ca.ET.182.01.1.1]|uniref:type VI secretion system-associated FHA domain protein n=1 Tax=Mesorhizobium sp. M8A.F.Ca.ET.182.01.1.1 TaxID=2563964 RepID=UPI00300566F6
LEIMFAKRRTGYLDAKHSIEDAFRDLKTHEIATYAAMPAASTSAAICAPSASIVTAVSPAMC